MMGGYLLFFLSLSGDLVLVLAQEDDTVVTMNRFNEPASSRTLDRGVNTDWEIPSNQLAYVTATK